MVQLWLRVLSCLQSASFNQIFTRKPDARGTEARSVDGTRCRESVVARLYALLKGGLDNAETL